MNTLGTMKCWTTTADPCGDHVYRVQFFDCFEPQREQSHHDTNLAKAVDGALRKFFGFYTEEEQTIVAAYWSSCRSGNGCVKYQVRIKLNSNTKLSASAPSEGMAIFIALWRHYLSHESKLEGCLAGTLGRQAKALLSQGA